MAYPSAPRVEWAPDGTRLLVCQGGAIRIHALDGGVQRVAAPGGFLDARWRRDGTIIGLDEYAVVRSFTMHGALYTDEPPPPRAVQYDGGVLAPSGAYFAYGATYLRLQVGERTLGVLDHFHGEPGQYGAALSADGTRLAVGYQTGAWQRTQPGRGWVVVDTTPQRRPASSYYYEPPAPLVDRGYYTVALDNAAPRLALDARARRLAFAAPEREPGFGVVRIGAGGARCTHDGGATAVALDERGVIAAYAYPPGRLRVDYLSPQVKGPANVEIVDTLWIDPDHPPVALAFDAGGHHLACLAADGAVEIVPVP